MSVVRVRHLDCCSTLTMPVGSPTFRMRPGTYHTRELQAASQRRSFNERLRYRPILWEHRPRFATYDDGGDEWLGFLAVRGLARLQMTSLRFR